VTARRRAALAGRAGLASAFVVLAACATPIGVSHMDPREVHRELTASALSTGRPSATSQELLTRLGLRARFARDPDGVLAELHAGLPPSGDTDRLFALAELSLLRAEEQQRADCALAAAVYAYAFLFPGGGADALDPFDPRVQVARNLYNRGLTLGLADPADGRVTVAAGSHALPFGRLDVEMAPGETSWVGWQLDDFVPVAEYRVRGLANRYRQPGIGAPLAASLGEPVPGAAPKGAGHLPPRLRVPVTAFLRIEQARDQIASGRVRGRLELYSEDDRAELRVDGRRVPREVEKSSSLAYQLEGAPVWDFGFAGFRLGDYLPAGQDVRLFFLHPYRPGRIPLVLVHGTFSSPATWAEMLNELENDAEVSRRYQIWLFLYNTGNPIAYSGGLLVQSLRDVVAELDPGGRDPALRRMVVAGHSQGGLLAKLTAVSSGDRFWRNVARKPLDAMSFQPETRELLRRSLFYEPLPFVRRLIFLSTPHRGSDLSSYRVASLVARLVKMPLRLSRLAVDLATQDPDALAVRQLGRLPTSLDNMRPGNPFVVALSELPIDPAVPAHSIIAVRGDGPLDEEGDGVVRYRSAHLDGVESEIVVRSGHSVQVTPAAIQEVRRILLEHAAAAP
jgi:pimeloyl-ACP methyl ester carboxylesterase